MDHADLLPIYIKVQKTVLNYLVPKWYSFTAAEVELYHHQYETYYVISKRRALLVNVIPVLLLQTAQTTTYTMFPAPVQYELYQYCTVINLLPVNGMYKMGSIKSFPQSS